MRGTECTSEGEQMLLMREQAQEKRKMINETNFEFDVVKKMGKLNLKCF